MHSVERKRLQGEKKTKSTRANNAMFDFSILRVLRKRQGHTIAEVSGMSGVSPAVISRLERNQGTAELETVFRLSRAYGLNGADLISLAESRSPHRKATEHYVSDGFAFERVSYGNMRCMLGNARAGARLSTPEIHRDEYELCWVLEGCIEVYLANERHILKAGDALQFDAVLVHAYEAIQDCRVILVHLTKDKRF
ncbi:MAG: helix-turn-helix domain-containing protein [Chitinivibrionales bacterium]|nr:helix-turn-helix domain-containing protein [Chitinivibrionales bacterium]